MSPNFQIGLSLDDAISISLETGRALRHRNWPPGKYYTAKRTQDTSIDLRNVDDKTDCLRSVVIHDAIDDNWYLESEALHSARKMANHAVAHLKKLKADAAAQLKEYQPS